MYGKCMKKKQKYKIGWVGFHQEGMDAFNGILEVGYKVDAVFTLDEESAQLRSGSISYDEMCEAHDIPLYKINNINDSNVIAILKKLDLDILFVIGRSQIIKKEAMACIKVGIIGAHASLLPHNRGSAPVNWAIINGEKVTGNSLIWLTEEVDEGDIIAQQEIDITLYDTCKSIYRKVAASNRDMILEFLNKSEQEIPPSTKQKNIDEPLLPRRRPQDGCIDWNQPATKIYDFIRAITHPYPGGFSYINGKKMLIWEVALLVDVIVPGCKPGQVIGAVYSPNACACGFLVACQRGVINILHMEDEMGNDYKGQALAELDYKDLEFLNE